MKRLVALLPVLIAFQAGAPPALAWTWPADGPVLRPFVFGDDPYAAGQHRGVDIAGRAGAPVLAPAAGLVTFAGSVPSGGRVVTVQTADGYSVTLVHLGSFEVDRDASVAEGAPVGTIGPSGEAEHAEPYVHLGVRVRSDPHGYVDPLTLLPKERARPPVAPPPPPPVPAPVQPAPPAPAPEAPERQEAQQPREREGRAPVAEPPAPVTARSDLAGVPLLVPRATRREAVSEKRVSDPPAQAPVSKRGVQARVASAPLVTAAGLPTRADIPGDRPALRDVPARTSPAGEDGRRPPVPSRAAALEGAAALLALGLGGLLLALRRRQLGQARSAHTLVSVVENRARRAAEDAGALRPAQEDGLVLDGDLERVALGQPEPLSDLDRDDDPAQLIQMPNDPCRHRARPAVPPGRFHRVGPRPPLRTGAEPISTR
jgi:Peptidase family M23